MGRHLNRKIKVLVSFVTSIHYYQTWAVLKGFGQQRENIGNLGYRYHSAWGMTEERRSAGGVMIPGALEECTDSGCLSMTCISERRGRQTRRSWPGSPNRVLFTALIGLDDATSVTPLYLVSWFS